MDWARFVAHTFIILGVITAVIGGLAYTLFYYVHPLALIPLAMVFIGSVVAGSGRYADWNENDRSAVPFARLRKSGSLVR